MIRFLVLIIRMLGMADDSNATPCVFTCALGALQITLLQIGKMMLADPSGFENNSYK